MKIIFLDFDGVLNSMAFFSAQPGALNRLDPEAIARLNDLVARSGAKVVVSSTWRIKRSVSELSAILAEHGFAGEVIDRTPVFPPTGSFADPFMMRSREIQAWIDACGESLESFVILDDIVIEGMDAFHVKTEFSMGLLDEHIDAALWILGSPDQPTGS